MHLLTKSEVMKKRAYSTIVRAKTKSTTTVIASTPTPDRYDDVVAGGDQWLIEQYMKNPVVQFGHDYNTPPVGRTDKLTTDKDGNLVATIRWDDSPTNPLGQTVAAQFRDGFMSAVSVGFQPTSTTPRNKLPTDHPAYGEKGMYFEGNRLLEISAVPVPANGEALALRGLATDQMKSILNVEETEDSYIVTYAKYPSGSEDEEPQEEAFGDEEEEDDALEEEGLEDEDDDLEEDAFGDEDEPEEEGAEDDEEDDEEEGYGGKKKPRKSMNVDTFLFSEPHLCEHRGSERKGNRRTNRAGSEHFSDFDEHPAKTEVQPSPDARRMALKSLVRDVLFELIGHDEIVRSLVVPDPSQTRSQRRDESMSQLFGIDK